MIVTRRKKEYRFMKMLSDYRAITNKWYRLICNIGIPVVVAVLSLILQQKLQGPLRIVIGVCISIAFLVTAEIVGDYWGFGPICVKGCFGMDYLKTAYRGRYMAQNALMMDIIVRPVRIFICMLIVIIPTAQASENAVQLLLFSFAIVSCESVWALNITRYIQTVQVVFFISGLFSLATLLLVECVLCKPSWKGFIWPFTAGLLVALVFGIFVTSRHMYKKVEASYMDVE